MVFKDDSEAPLVPAVFPDRTSAATAIQALHKAGIPAADIGVAIPIREANRVREESESHVLEGAGRGAAVGAPLGVLGGIGLAALALTTPLGVGGLFVAGASGLLWGGTVGGLLGMVTRVRRSPDVDRWCELELDANSVLVAVRVHDWSREPEIATLLTGSGAVAVLDRTDLDHSWQELEGEHRSGQAAPAQA
ncbi:MAG: hypothetical protein JO057_03235 [Chloroflexi bacterium]|nr:hypothetical protein [Chloroflexota bacterium]